MNLKKLIRQYQGLIISALTLVACLFGFVLGIVPLARKAIDLKNQSTTLSQEVDALNQKTSLLQALNEDELRSNIEMLLTAVPSDKSPVTLWGTLDGLLSSSGVSMDTLLLSSYGSLSTASAERLTADEKTVGAKLIPFSLNLTGTFDQIHNFLTACISVRRLLRARSFNISVGEEGAVSATIEMDTFYAPLPVSIGSPSQPLAVLSGADENLIASVSGMQLLVQQASPLTPTTGGPVKPDPFSL